MATKFVLRTDKTEGYATLYARIQSRAHKINIRVSTGLEVDVKEWNKSLASAKALTAFRSGKGKDLFIKLDAIMYTIDSLTSEGVTLTPDLVKGRIHGIVFAEQIKAEKERQEAELTRIKEDASTFINFVDRFIGECETGKRKKKGGTTNVSSGTIKSYQGFR